MVAVLQRVSRGRVSVANKTAGSIGHGLVVLLGVYGSDGEGEADKLADKLVNLRIFGDDEDKMNLSLLDVEGEALVISQFTLCADYRKGRRPSFIKAAPPDSAERLYDYFIGKLSEHGVKVESGRFGTMMDVELVNKGPVTIVLDSNELA